MSSDKILNPFTGRWVSRNGAIGRKLLKAQSQGIYDSTEVRFVTYEVVNFGPELASFSPCRLATMASHSAILLKDNNGVGYIYEWGNLTFKSDEDTSPRFKFENGYFVYPDQSWFGCLGQTGSINKVVTPAEVDSFNEFWDNDYGKGGSYPSNCRGYVHMLIYFLGEDPYFDTECASQSFYPRSKPSSSKNNIDDEDMMEQYNEFINANQ